MIAFEAIYYDGRSATAHPVRVVFTDNDHLEIMGLDNPLVIPLSQVDISARLGNSARFLRFKGGGKCETLDNRAVDSVLSMSGNEPGSQWVHRLEANWGIALGAIVLTALLCFGGLKWGVPWGARKVAFAIPIEAVQAMSKETITYLDRLMFKPTELEDERMAELRSKFASLAQLGLDFRLDLQFRSGDKVGPNAFALPDGTVVITDELVHLAENDEQLLSILAHEIGHVHARHALRSLLENSTMGLLLTAVTGDISSSVSAVGAIPAILVHAKYSRELEAEADSFALELMQKAKIDKHHFADIMEALSEALPDYSDSMLSTHPPSEARIQRFREAN